MADESKLITSVSRSATEQLQIAINEYRGKKYLDLRIFYTTDNGANWLPTKKGITVSPENLETVKKAIETAITELSTQED